MMLGVGAESYVKTTQGPWDHRVQKLERDLVGARDWRSLSELFWVLNRSVAYVAVQNEAPLPKARADANHQGIDLITDRYWAVHTLSNTRQPPHTAPNGGRFQITIDGADFTIGIRFVGDGYYDPKWEEEILASRFLDPRGFYRPSDRDCFQALAYRAVVHRAAPTGEDKERLAVMASKLRLGGWDLDALNDPRQMKTLLDRLLQDRGCSYVEPLDKTVFYNLEFPRGRRPPVRRLVDVLRRQLALMTKKFAMPLLAAYWHGRDRLLLRFPRLRSAKRLLRGLS